MTDLKKQLQKLDISKLRLKNGRTVASEIMHHAAILADCIEMELDAVYDSYSPKVYRRTYDLYNSLYLDGKVRIDVTGKGAKLSVGVHFDDGAIHTGFGGEKVNTAILLNEGWQTHGSFAHVPYFGYRDGTHFIEKGIERYKEKVKNPFVIKLAINGEERIF